MRLVETIILLAISMTAYRAHPSQQRKPNKGANNSKAATSSNSTDEHKTSQEFESIYVRFSADIPETPPWLPPDDGDLVRNRRSTNRSMNHVRRSVCDGVSRWITKSTAEDMWGNTVNVAQKIDISGTRVNQYFFETHCLREHCQCRGIDTAHYNSKCESKHIWAYAKVIDRFGTEGWNLIKLRGSCSCTITEKVEEIYQSIWDDLR